MDGVGQPSLSLPDVAQIVVGPGKVGIQLQRPAVTGDGLGNSPQRAIGFAEVVVKQGLAGVERDGSLDVAHRRLGPARLLGDDSQQVQSLGLIGLGGQDLPVELLRGLQAAGLVVLDGDRECFGKACHGFARSKPDAQARPTLDDFLACALGFYRAVNNRGWVERVLTDTGIAEPGFYRDV